MTSFRIETSKNLENLTILPKKILLVFGLVKICKLRGKSSKWVTVLELRRASEF